MTLTQPQQRKVEQNLGLVGKVIKDKVHNPGQNSIYSYDDLYQIGCIGLCKAAYSDKGGCFSTYASIIIFVLLIAFSARYRLQEEGSR